MAAEVHYKTRRVWTYPRNEWDPAWYGKFGVPYLGGDEWGRRTLVVGLWFVGYVVWAWRTCWCQECHEIREQTYRMLNDDDRGGRDGSGRARRVRQGEDMTSRYESRPFVPDSTDPRQVVAEVLARRDGRSEIAPGNWWVAGAIVKALKDKRMIRPLRDRRGA